MDTIYVVRAMPAQGHERRWCVQRPFTKSPQDVVVVDEPKPHKRLVVDGRETQKIAEYSYEVTPLELEELKRDPHLAVSLKGSGDGDPDQINTAKARVQVLEQQLLEKSRELQQAVEDAKQTRIGAERMAADLGARVAQLQQQLDNAQHITADKMARKGK